MPQQSRYTDEQVEELLVEIAHLLEQRKVPVDLSLMVLGNTVTNLINTKISSIQRNILATSFAEALQASIREN